MPDKKKEPAAAATATSSKKIISIDNYTPKDSVCQVPLKKYLDKLADECERVLKLEQEIAETFTDGSFELCCSCWYYETMTKLPKVHIYKGIERACAEVGEKLQKEKIEYDNESYQFEYYFIYRGIKFFQIGESGERVVE